MKRDFRVWVDADGVLFDFDKAAERILGEDPREFEAREGSDVFWWSLRQSGDFFLNLELMPDAMELMKYLWINDFDPWILTGVPSQIPEGHLQKQQAIRKAFGESQPAVTCQSKHKANFCRRGDIIIDDWPKHTQKWLDKGGEWILHTSAEQSIKDLEAIIEKRRMAAIYDR